MTAWIKAKKTSKRISLRIRSYDFNLSLFEKKHSSWSQPTRKTSDSPFQAWSNFKSLHWRTKVSPVNPQIYSDTIYRITCWCHVTLSHILLFNKQTCLKNTNKSATAACIGRRATTGLLDQLGNKLRPGSETQAWCLMSTRGNRTRLARRSRVIIQH